MRSRLIGGALTAGCLLIFGAPAQAQSRHFNVPAQDAVIGIPEFARQAGIQILVSESAVRGRRTNAITGDLATGPALQRLLVGTGLVVTSNDGRTLTLGPQMHVEPTVVPELDPPQAVSEVVVTALRRTQRAQEIPVSITVVDASALKAKEAQDFRDYLTTIPGVTYAENNFGGMRVTIRGVSDGIGTTDPLAGIYIDETPVTETYLPTLDPDVYDVQRVEVLKGPQGTLYGSGSMGGTVRVITKQPKLDVFEGAIDATASDVSHGGWNRRVDGVVNIPILEDKIALRVSGGYRKDDGWIDDLPRNEPNANTIEKQNLHAQLLLKPGADTSVTLSFMYQHDDLGLPPFDDLTTADPYASDRIFQQSGNATARLYSLTVRQDFERMSLTSATNYLSKDAFTSYDVTTSLRPLLGFLGVNLGPDEGIGLDSSTHLDLFTQEVRLASTGHNRLDWLAGAFYSDVTSNFPQGIDLSQAPSANGILTGPGLLESTQHYSTRQVAAFGELTLNVTDKLSLTGGIRVFNVKQDNVLSGSGFLNGGSTISTQQSDLSSSTKKALLKYQFDHDHMVYAQAAQGYRNGGPNGNVPLSVCAAALAAAGYSSVPSSYKADSLWNYEVGSKNTFLDGRMQLNASAFYIDWSNIQSFIGLSCGSSFIVNAGKAVSKGAEVETTVQPIEGLTLTGSASYIDSTLTSVAPGVVANEGDRLPLTAKWSWNLAAQYDHPVSNGLTGFVRGEVNHVGDRWNLFAGSGARATLLPAYTTLAARVGVRTDRWSFAVFGTNLTDQRIIYNASLPLYDLVGRPRTVGVNVSANF